MRMRRRKRLTAASTKRATAHPGTKTVTFVVGELFMVVDFKGCAVVNLVELIVGFPTVLWMEINVLLGAAVVVLLGIVVVVPFGAGVMVAFGTEVMVSVVVVPLEAVGMVPMGAALVVPLGAAVVVPLGTSVVVPLVTALMVLLGAAEILVLSISELVVVFRCIVVVLKGRGVVEWMEFVMFPTTALEPNGWEVDMLGERVDGRWLVKDSVSIMMSGVEVKCVVTEGMVVKVVSLCVVVGGLLKISSPRGSSVGSSSVGEIECTIYWLIIFFFLSFIWQLISTTELKTNNNLDFLCNFLGIW